MKKIILFILCFTLICSTVLAEEINNNSNNEQDTSAFHSAFGLSKGATGEEISKTIQSMFSVSPASSDQNYFFPTSQYLYDLPIYCIYASVDENIENRVIDISLKDDCLNADNIQSLYQHFCSEYGEPTKNMVSKSIVTINGKEEVPISINDTAELQLAIDQCAISGYIAWDNICLTFSAFVSSYDNDIVRSLEIWISL